MKLPTLALVGTMLAATSAFAHHPFSSEFDANAPIRLEGKVTRVDWNNPHVVINLTEINGNRMWNLEAAGPTELGKKGWSRDTIKAGDQITVEAYRAKSEPMTASARVIQLPDGKKMSAADDQDGGPKIAPAP